VTFRLDSLLLASNLFLLSWTFDLLMCMGKVMTSFVRNVVQTSGDEESQEIYKETTQQRPRQILVVDKIIILTKPFIPTA